MSLITKKKFTFDNYGGVYQLHIRDATDLAALEELDEPFWTAVSAPVDQFRCDSVLLDLLDSGDNGRLLSSELRRVVAWMLRVLRDTTGVDERRDSLDLEALNVDDAEGKVLHSAASRVLTNLGVNDGKTLALEHVRSNQASFVNGTPNGDGIIPPDDIEDSKVRVLIEDIAATVGSVVDVNGLNGVNIELLNEFIEKAHVFVSWHDDGEQLKDDLRLFPFADDTDSRYALYKKLEGAIDDYFSACRRAAFDSIMGAKTAPDIKPIDDIAQSDEYLAAAPLTAAREDEILRVRDPVNPHYRDNLASFVKLIARPILVSDTVAEEMTDSQWATIKGIFSTYEQRLQTPHGEEVASLGADKLRALLAGDVPDALRTLIESDMAAGVESEALRDLEFLILLQKWILDLCNNFVSFSDLYEPDRHAMFEVGRVVMDGRIFRFNFRVKDVNAHSEIAERSGIFLLYSEVTGSAGEETFFIVTPVTRGYIGDLAVGKRGVLFDFEEREWDVRIVKVVQNPVSLGEAIIAPFKRIATLISSTAERITVGAEKQLEGRVSKAGTAVETRVKDGIPSTGSVPAAASAQVPAPNASAGGMQSLLLGGGVAFAALGSSFAYIAAKFQGFNPWYALVVLAVGIAIVLVPTTILAVIRLRRRNVSAILEASGFAINSPMRLTDSLSRLIVQEPPHPKSFRRIRKDLAKTLVETLHKEIGSGK
ncbi:hypothetical protein ACFL1X_01880 [Candidatus Hydrogenedentota bacterium]